MATTREENSAKGDSTAEEWTPSDPTYGCSYATVVITDAHPDPRLRSPMAHLVTAIIKPFKLEEVKDALRGAGLLGLTVSEVQGYGRQGGKSETFRGSEYTIEFVPKVKIEVLCESTDVDKVVDLIATAAKTGKIGDGKIWSYDLGTVMRIRTGEIGDSAI